MTQHTPESVTQLLERWGRGDRAALDELMPLVYEELRRLAANYLRRERADHTLEPTALVNEAYLLLVGQRSARWQNRAQFVGVAANMMRRILVSYARAHNAAKRGGLHFTVSLGEAVGELTGTGRWHLTHDAGLTDVRYDWNVRTTRPWMNLLAPVARPIFKWNHDVVMDWGADGLARRLGVERLN